MADRPVPRLPGIHGLRAVAALGVLALHTAGIPALALPPSIAGFVQHLGIGVFLFFIVSAYSLLYSHERVAQTPGWVRVYLIKRLFRIAPLFWVMLAANWAHPFYGAWSAGEIAANAVFIFNFFPGWQESLVPAGWTIGLEMPFYLCLPLLMLGIRGPRTAALFLMVTAVVGVLDRVWLTAEGFGTPGGYAALAFAANLYVFAVGIAAYHAVKAWTGSKAWWRLVGAVGAAIISLLMFDLRPNPTLYLGGAPNLVLWSCALGMICAWQAVAPSWLLATRPMQWVGERSFSVYLLHPFVIFWLIKAGAYAAIYAAFAPVIGLWSYLVCLALNVALVLPSAALTYRLIEVPGQKIGALLVRSLRERLNVDVGVDGAGGALRDLRAELNGAKIPSRDGRRGVGFRVGTIDRIRGHRGHC